MKGTGLAVWLAVVAASFAAIAAPKPKEKEPDPLPAPEVRLRVEPGASGKPWRVELANVGTVPLRVVADARLLRLTITSEASAAASVVKGKPKKPPAPTECVLPGAMRSDGRVLDLPPGTKYVETFDPRLFCLDRAKQLAPGATVTARLGWAAPQTAKGKKPAPLSPPFAVRPSPLSSVEVASAKEVGAAPIVLDASTALLAPASTSTTTPRPIVATAGGARSFAIGTDVEASITIKNASKEKRTLYPRPQLVDARVVDPRGALYVCAGPPMTPAPISDFVTKLAPNATWSATVPLKNLCPPGTFDVPGLYLVTPVLHLPAIPNEKDAIVGDVAAEQPQLVRIETGTKPFHPAPPSTTK